MGLNFVVYLDGWDKLKLFGICIYGCVDGFLRCFFWFRVCNLNKNLEYVLRFNLDYVKEISGIFVVIYVDRGIENCIIRDL